ncbi:MAG: hypothetical protein HY567_01770 [Candidatus Kerfeldbacteria bacterium]|nr:hypothetical protein [Candidatus Kerfeldbacteria bacterium]
MTTRKTYAGNQELGDAMIGRAYLAIEHSLLDSVRSQRRYEAHVTRSLDADPDPIAPLPPPPFALPENERRFEDDDWMAFLKPWFERAMNDLSTVHRTLFELRLRDNLSFPEMLALLPEQQRPKGRSPENTLRSRYEAALREFRSNLRQHLSKDIALRRIPSDEAETLEALLHQLKLSTDR